MKDLVELLKQNNNAVFVFPSEIAVSFWRKRYLDISGKKAVRNDKFISWDSFKENFSPHNKTKKPVNNVIRRLFANYIIEKNAMDCIFKIILPPEFSNAATGFTDSISRMLPELKRLVDLIDQKNYGDYFPSEDYKILYKNYSDFLNKNSLFEPSWEITEMETIEKTHFIIAPNLLEDFNQYSVFLNKAGCKFFYPQTALEKNVIKVFENSLIEVDSVLNDIAMLIKNGTPPYKVLITSPDDETIKLLLSKAKLRGLPVINRSGKPISEYPAGRLPLLLLECQNSNFSLNSMKNLLLFQAFNWKEASKIKQLIRFGIEHRCLKNTGTKKNEDEWEKRLSLAKEFSLLKFYKTLKNRIINFCQAKTFKKIALEFQIFVSTFLDTNLENWDAECEQVFQRSREVLSSLCELEKNIKEITIKSPLNIWIKLLNEKIYVQKQEQGGVDLYKYRVSAIMHPEYHFICGISHQKSMVYTKPFSFLTDQQRLLLSENELNMTEDFLGIYGISGQKINFSCAIETFSGTSLIPAVFVKNTKIIQGISENEEPVLLENSWWKKATNGEYSNNLELSQIQKEGFVYSEKTFFKNKSFDASTNIITEKSIKKKVLNKLYKEQGFIKISSTALSKWLECPFAFFLERVLSIHEIDYKLKVEDPMEEGNIYHKILHHFFDEIKRQARAFNASHYLEEYTKIINHKANEVFKEWESTKNYFFGPSWEAFKKRSLNYLLKFPEAEALFFEGLLPQILETPLELIIEQHKIIINGFADRISVNENAAVVVDYKRKWNKKGRKYFVNYDENGSLLSPKIGHQIPIYILLAREQGLEITGASYYSIMEQKHHPVFGYGGMLNNEDITALCKKTIDDVVTMGQNIRKLDFTCPGRCDGCAFRAICRKRFNVRWSE